MDTIERPNPRAVIGGNLPPLAEMLVEETDAFRKRSAELLATAAVIAVVDEESAGKAAVLAKMIRDHADEIEAAREVRKAPILADGRTVDATFGALTLPLVGPEPKKKRTGAFGNVANLVDEYRRKKDAAVAAERQRLLDEAAEANRRAEEEARKRREADAQAERDRQAAAQREREAAQQAERERQAAAERQRKLEEEAARSGDLAAAAEAARAKEEADRIEAERRQQEAEAARLRAEEEQRTTQRRLDAELAERADREKAEQLTRQAERTVAGPIDSGYGVKATSRADWKYEIEDFPAALKHARAVDNGAIRAAVEEIIKRQIRAKVRVFPGVRIWNATKTAIL